MSAVNISNQSELTTFLNDLTQTNGSITDDILLSSDFNFVSDGMKILSTNGIFKLTKNVEQINTGSLYSLNNITDNGFIVGAYIDKDMFNDNYNVEFTPSNYPEYFPDMSPLIDENIIEGDKNPDDRLISSIWDDWGNDIFDDWGFFYIYDNESGQYYFPLFSPQNQNDGDLITQEFIAFGRTFTITQGYPVQGIFKFDISVNDNKPFKFGAYGNMGSDGDHINTDLTYPYLIDSTNLTLYYLKQQEEGDSHEILYSYFIPKNISANENKTYNLYQNNGYDDNSLMSNTVTNGLIVYFSKTNDVKEWIINDLGLIM